MAFPAARMWPCWLNAGPTYSALGPHSPSIHTDFLPFLRVIVGSMLFYCLCLHGWLYSMAFPEARLAESGAKSTGVQPTFNQPCPHSSKQTAYFLDGDCNGLRVSVGATLFHWLYFRGGYSMSIPVAMLWQCRLNFTGIEPTSNQHCPHSDIRFPSFLDYDCNAHPVNVGAMLFHWVYLQGGFYSMAFPVAML